MEIVVATGNRNKLSELRTIGDRFHLRLLSPAEAQGKFNLPPVPDCEESGTTFAENAVLKARTFLAWSGLPSLGDDSGIEVDALGGAPGIYSARYGGEGASEQAKIEKLLRELDAAMQASPQATRRGRFRCALALAFPDGRMMESQGTLEGKILLQPQGAGGFGYDPILWIDELAATLAEVDFDVTCNKGFRAKAAEQLFRQLL